MAGTKEQLPSNITEGVSDKSPLISKILATTKLALLSAVVAGGISGKPEPAFAQEKTIQYADASDSITPASISDANPSTEEIQFPTEFVFSNTQGETFTVSGNPDDLFVAWSLQQVFSVIPDANKAQIEQQWMSLSINDMKQVLDIHAGKLSLDGQTPAHIFYQDMLVVFLELGRNSFIEITGKDPEFADYPPEDRSADWDDFIENYSAGEVDTLLDYRVRDNLDFFQGISLFFPHHPVTARIETELNIIASKQQISQANEQISQANEQIARANEQITNGEERIAHLNEVIHALRKINATLSQANETVTN